MDFVTTGDIAKRLNADRDSVAYAIRKAKIKPVGRAGIVRLFSGTALATVGDFLERKRHGRKESANGIPQEGRALRREGERL